MIAVWSVEVRSAVLRVTGSEVMPAAVLSDILLTKAVATARLYATTLIKIRPYRVWIPTNRTASISLGLPEGTTAPRPKRGQVRWGDVTSRVVDENGGGTCVVRMSFVDGEVVGGEVGVVAARGGDGVGVAVCVEQDVAGGEAGGVDVGVGAGVPEGVVVGGDGGGRVVEGDGDHVVRAGVPDERGDGTGPGGAGGRVGGGDLVTESNVDDRFLHAVGQENGGVGGEAVPAGLSRVFGGADGALAAAGGIGGFDAAFGGESAA